MRQVDFNRVVSAMRVVCAALPDAKQDCADIVRGAFMHLSPKPIPGTFPATGADGKAFQAPNLTSAEVEYGQCSGKLAAIRAYLRRNAPDMTLIQAKYAVETWFDLHSLTFYSGNGALAEYAGR